MFAFQWLCLLHQKVQQLSRSKLWTSVRLDYELGGIYEVKVDRKDDYLGEILKSACRFAVSGTLQTLMQDITLHNNIKMTTVIADTNEKKQLRFMLKS